MTITKLQPLQSNFEDIFRFLELVQKYTSKYGNWSIIQDEWLINKMAQDLTSFYRTVPTCDRLDLITYESKKHISLEINGERFLNAKNPKEFLITLLIKRDERDKTFKAILALYDKNNLVRGLDSVNLNDIILYSEDLGISSNIGTLKKNLETLYSSTSILKITKEKVTLNINKYMKLSGIKIGRDNGDITEDEFLEAIIKSYEELSTKKGTKYISIPELRKPVSTLLDLSSYEIFDNRLKLRPVFNYKNKKIILLHPRGPRGGKKGSIKGIDGRWYHHIFIT